MIIHTAYGTWYVQRYERVNTAQYTAQYRTAPRGRARKGTTLLNRARLSQNLSYFVEMKSNIHEEQDFAGRGVPEIGGLIYCSRRVHYFHCAVLFLVRRFASPFVLVMFSLVFFSRFFRDFLSCFWCFSFSVFSSHGDILRAISERSLQHANRPERREVLDRERARAVALKQAEAIAAARLQAEENSGNKIKVLLRMI